LTFFFFGRTFIHIVPLPHITWLQPYVCFDSNLLLGSYFSIKWMLTLPEGVKYIHLLFTLVINFNGDTTPVSESGSLFHMFSKL